MPDQRYYLAACNTALLHSSSNKHFGLRAENTASSCIFKQLSSIDHCFGLMRCIHDSAEVPVLERRGRAPNGRDGGRRGKRVRSVLPRAAIVVLELQA